MECSIVISLISNTHISFSSSSHILARGYEIVNLHNHRNALRRQLNSRKGNQQRVERHFLPTCRKRRRDGYLHRGCVFLGRDGCAVRLQWKWRISHVSARIVGISSRDSAYASIIWDSTPPRVLANWERRTIRRFRGSSPAIMAGTFTRERTTQRASWRLLSASAQTKFISTPDKNGDSTFRTFNPGNMDILDAVLVDLFN